MGDFYGLILENLDIFTYCEDINKLLIRIQEIRIKFKFNKNAYLFFFDDNEELKKKTNIVIPPWSAALSFNSYIIMVNPSYWKRKKKSLNEAIIHEFIHVVVNNTYKYECPLWLNEGLAQYYSNEYLKFINCKKDLPEDLDIYSLDYGDYDNLLYYISAKLVKDLIDTFGELFIVEKIRKTNNIEGDEVIGRIPMKKYLSKFNSY